MVKKAVYVISRDYEDLSDYTEQIIQNEKLHEFLKSQKNFISEHYWTKKWDKYKKYANDYELIFTSGYGFPSISKHSPISRSYFKLWEILHDFKDSIDLASPNGLQCMFLAEGPGGFVEAYCNLRNKLGSTSNDLIYGVTLISSDRNIPAWKLSNELISNNNIHILKGADNSGSLYNPEDISHIVSKVGYHSCNLVTADGGFDFSTDFNNQEELSTKLILSEILTSIQLQKEHGCFLLKIYDINSLCTMQLLFVLKELYESISFTKPLSSRPANSEKYVMCTNFKGPMHQNYNKYRYILATALNTWDEMRSIQISISAAFVKDIVEYNTFYIIKQVLHINKTLCFISMIKSDKDEILKKNVWYQLKKAIKWCHKYNIVISVDALRSYNAVYK